MYLVTAHGPFKSSRGTTLGIKTWTGEGVGVIASDCHLAVFVMAGGAGPMEIFNSNMGPREWLWHIIQCINDMVQGHRLT